MHLEAIMWIVPGLTDLSGVSFRNGFDFMLKTEIENRL